MLAGATLGANFKIQIIIYKNRLLLKNICFELKLLATDEDKILWAEPWAEEIYIAIGKSVSSRV